MERNSQQYSSRRQERGRGLTWFALLMLGYCNWNSLAVAQSLEPSASSVAEIALSGAGVTLPNGSSALWINPSLLSCSPSQYRFAFALLLKSVRRSVFRASPVVNQSFPEARDMSAVQTIPAFSAAFTLWKGHLDLGVGYHWGLNENSQFPQQDIEEDRLAPARYRGVELELRQQIFSIGLSSGFKRIALGAALELSRLSVYHRQSWWAGTSGDVSQLEDPTLDLDMAFRGKGAVGVGGRFGIWVKPLSYVSAGFAVRLPVTSTIKGPVSFAGSNAAPSGYESLSAQNGFAQFDFTVPVRWQGGLAIGPPRLQWILEASMTSWSSNPEITAEFSEVALNLQREMEPMKTIPVTNVPLGIRFQDHWAIYSGLVFVPWIDSLILRGSYAFHRGASLSSAPMSTVIDLNRHTWGVGVEVVQHPMRLGLAFAQSFEAELNALGEDAFLINPLEPNVTAIVGKGRYVTSSIEVLMEAQVNW